jgi:ABC-2 type transport system permease protein
VLLLWRLRLAIALNATAPASGLRPSAGKAGFLRGSQPHRALAVGAFALSTAPAWGLGGAFYALMRWSPVASSSVWPAFVLNLLCFVCAAVWASWPILSAGVDDHSELSRYAAFPISGARLLFASSVASLFEPRSIVIYSPVAGAALGYLRGRPPSSWPLALALFVLYALLNAAWGRAGLHLVLNVLRGKRSAETIGGFFVVVLVVCSFIPPVDTRWLHNLGAGLDAFDLTLIQNAAVALGRVPPGFFGAGLELLAAGRPLGALVRGAGMAFFAAVGYGLAYRLLLAFHRRTGRAGPARAAGDQDPFARTRSRYTTLVVREALDLWRNPKARLLASAPFLLAILFRVTSGRDLVAFFAGPKADAWILGSLCLYGAVVMGSTFSQNMFGYDGQALAVFLAAPMRLDEVLRAKNRVHGLAAGLMGVSLCAFYVAYFRAARPVDVACALAAVATVIPVLLAAGNFLSLYFPVKFHASLERRDRIPFAASMLGVAAASLGSAPFVLALRAGGPLGASWLSALVIALCGAGAWAAYRALLPLALRLLEARRELVLQAVTRG